MWYLFIVAASYILLICYDIASLYGKKSLSYVFALLGIGLQCISTGYGVYLSLSDVSLEVYFNHAFEKSISCIGVICSFGLLVYCLFFALPAKDTYISNDNQSNNNQLKLVNTGFYALCRHPGVWFLSLFYLFLGIVFEHSIMFYLWIANTVGDVIYVLIQDIYIFQKTICDYHSYQTETPFLIPTKKSILKMMNYKKPHPLKDDAHPSKEDRTPIIENEIEVRDNDFI